ncbi:MAG: tRNA pseudouridine(13) synthase TruD, partial [Planctomycetota bacterium]
MASNTAPPPPTPRLTADLPGVGGVIKQRHDDFQVEELPLYEPSGQGEHLMLLVEKRGRTTQDAIKRIADAFRIGKRDIGYAGLKDKHALTRQHLTVHLPGKTEDGERIGQALERCEALRDIDVLWATPHANKLKRGHLAGNQFTITIRDVGVAAAIRAKPILDRLAAVGIPNYYGPQRFGVRRNAHTLGRLLLLGQHEAFIEEMLARPGDDDDPRLADARALFRAGDVSAAIDAWPRALPYDRQLLDALRKQEPADQAVAAISREHRDFLLSAAQSAAFNRVVAQRL